MQKTATLNFRVDPAMRDQAQAIYAKWGLSLADALNIFIAKSIDVGGLPFELRDEAEPFATETEADAFISRISKELIDEAW